jgi:hypothetical protein
MHHNGLDTKSVGVLHFLALRSVLHLAKRPNRSSILYSYALIPMRMAVSIEITVEDASMCLTFGFICGLQSARMARLQG